MVAERVRTPEPLPVLVEPLQPSSDAFRATGWTIETVHGWRRRITRNHADDEQGAAVQHIIVRYLVHGVERNQIAVETGYSPRQLQQIVMGRVWESYTLAVLGALADLGISSKKGLRPHRYSGHITRPDEIIGAQQEILEQIVGVLWNDQREGAQRIVATARLLLAGREPVRLP